MKLTIKIKLSADEEQRKPLLNTVEEFNKACNYISEVAFENKIANKIALQKIVYYDVRDKFKLSAQMAIRAIAKVVESYKRNKKIKPMFKLQGAMMYDQRILSWKGLDRVSILTLDGRLTVPIVIGGYYNQFANRIKGQADLIYVNNTFYLYATVDVPEPDEIKPIGGLGCDLGIVNLLVDSDGNTYPGSKLRKSDKKIIE